MDIIEALLQVVEKGKKTARGILDRDYENQVIQQMLIPPKASNRRETTEEKWINQLYQGDNLIIMEKLLEEGYGEKLDLIYIDPPFLTNANYKGRIVVEKGIPKKPWVFT